MDNITICDITAFDYWRTPPAIQWLFAGDEADPALLKTFGENTVLEAREAMAAFPLCQTMLRPNPSTRNLGAAAKILKTAVPLLATNHYGPIDIAANRRAEYHSSSIIRSRFSAGDLPFGSAIPISDYVSITSPAFTLLQLAGRSNLARTIMLATELCGSFAIYQMPDPIKRVLQTFAHQRTFPKIGGWEPFIDESGKLTNLWARPPLTTPQELLRMASEAAPKRGCENLRLAANLVVPRAASPFEARTGMLLGLSRRRGGEGHSGFSFNKSISLSRSAQALARRGHCICDLYWEEGVDVECQSALVHDKASSFLSDSDRTTALKHMGIDVLPITYGQIQSETRFAAFSATLAAIRGTRHRPKTQRQIAATQALRAEVFRDWSTIHLV